MLASAAALEEAGLDVRRFNFPYREQGRRIPDRMPTLCAAFAAFVEREREAGKKLFIGGRSMGGRVATMMAADGFACDGLILLAYPLHPAGKPEKLRDAHLPRVTVPAICFNGTKDDLCRRDLLQKALEPVRAPWEMHWIEGANHSLSTAKALAEIREATGRWLSGA